MADLFGTTSTIDAEENKDAITKRNTGAEGLDRAFQKGQGSAITKGANAGRLAATRATSAGVSRGEAEDIGQQAANKEAMGSVVGETQSAMDKQAEEVKEAENKLAEAQKAQEEMYQIADGIGQANNAAGTTALSALLGPVVGGAIGAGVNMGRSLLSGKLAKSGNSTARKIAPWVNMLLSDERMKELDEKYGYKPKLKHKRLVSREW